MLLHTSRFKKFSWGGPPDPLFLGGGIPYLQTPWKAAPPPNKILDMPLFTSKAVFFIN